MAQSQRHYKTAPQQEVRDRLNDITGDQGVKTSNQAQHHNTELRKASWQTQGMMWTQLSMIMAGAKLCGTSHQRKSLIEYDQTDFAKCCFKR